MKSFIKTHKFGISLLFASTVGAGLIWIWGGCPIHQIFHIDCLGCGMTRACLAALRLDFRTAFHLHPMFWSAPIIAIYIVFEGKLFKKKIIDTTVMILIVTGFVAQYILKYKGII